MSSTKQFLLSFIICLIAFSLIAFAISGIFADNGDSDDTKDKISTDVLENTKKPLSDSAIKSEGRTVSALIVGLDPVDPALCEVDALFVIKADVDNKQLFVCSVPADAKYEISGSYTEKGSSESHNYTYFMSFKDTIIERNAAEDSFSEGLEYLKGKASAVTGVNIDYYFAININQARNIFDKFTEGKDIGFTVPEPLRYDYNPTTDEEGNIVNDYKDSSFDIVVNEGAIKDVSGTMAVDIARYKDYTGREDRESMQVKLIKAFVEQALTPDNSFKTQLMSANDPLSIFGIKDTNITADQIKGHLDDLFSLSEYEFNSVSINFYNNEISNGSITTIHEDFK